MMRSGFMAGAIAALALLAGTANAQAPAPGDDSAQRVLHIATRDSGPVHQRLTLALDKAAVVELDADSRDVLVSNPDIVDAVVRTPRRIFLLAMKTGQTNAFFFDGTGRQLLSIDIRVEKDVADLSGMIHTTLPGSNVRVEALNDNVVLSGSVESQQQATRAADLAARFAGDASKVVNMLSVADSQQVMLKVRVAEMQRTIAKQFGINLAAAGVAAGMPMTVATDDQFGLIGRALSDISGGQLGAVCNPLPSNGQTGVGQTACTGGPNNLQGTLKALEQVGLIHTLAEPNLTAVSGETAKFLAGGEFPVPVAKDQQGNVTVEFKQFGVGLSFTPVVLSSGRISLQISTEVSELTNTGSFTLQGAAGTSNGLTIPGLDVRRAETTIELPSGGSFAIAGLMQHNTSQVLQSFPGLKDMPVLGALFRSRDFENDESELVVLVSAYLVNPVAEAKLAAPTDGFSAPSDPETILMGKLNSTYKPDQQPAKAPPPNTVGFIVQ
jgi:pilus assembly protein CpaC